MLRTAQRIVLLGALTAGGCQPPPPTPPGEPQRPTPVAADQSPTPRTAQTAPSATEPAAMDDGANQAVRDYLADLQAATERAAEPPPSAPTPQRSAPNVSPVAGRTPPAQAEALTGATEQPSDPAMLQARANAPIAIPQPSAADAPARPQVLAAHVLDANPAAPTESPAPASIGIHQGLDVVPPAAPATLTKVIAEAREALAEDPSNGSKQWRLSLLELAAGTPSATTNISDGLGEQARTLVQRQMKAVAETDRLLADPLVGSDQALAAVEAVRTVLRRDAELEIPTVALCGRVTTFGIYEEMPANGLLPYQSNRVIVYCEVRNFHSEPAEGHAYRTLLATRLELFSAEGESRWVRQEDHIEDVSRSRREDFFLTQLVTFPSDLGPGTYTLKVTITDLLASKTNEAAHTFTIGHAAADAPPR